MRLTLPWKNLFDAGNFMPHGHCYLWVPGLIRLHLFTDLAIGLAYIAISCTLAYLVRKAKKDIPFSWIFVCFGLFIIACGATHLMEIWTLWVPLYWLSGAVKLVTALASVATAVVLPPLVPKSLAMIRSAKPSDRRHTELQQAYVALQKEIAERKKAELEIREFNSQLEERVNNRTAELSAANLALAGLAAIVESSSDAIVSLDQDRRITTWNPAAERIYGFPKLEVLGHSVSMLAPPGRSGETPGLVDRLKLGEPIISFETIRLRKTGESINVSLTLSPIRNEAGEFQGTSIISRDITERKRGEEMFRLAVEAAPNAMVIVNGEGKIVLVNAQTEKLFGYRRDELIGKDLNILVPRKYRKAHRAHQSEFNRNPHARAVASRRGDLYGLRKDGSEFPVEIGLNPIQTEQGAWVLSAIVDITERKRAEEEISLLNRDLERRVAERTAELTAANAEMEAFSYSISHDLRAPLRQVAGFSKIIAEEYGPGLTPDCARYLNMVQDGAQQMGQMVDDLLDLSRIGRQLVSRRPTPLGPVVDAALAILQPDLLNREIEWQIESLCSVEGDARLLKQVFVNLLSNAVKFTRPRDHAFIQVGQTTVAGEPVIFVRDNGAGFDMKYAGKLFGVFQRLHKARDFEGNGVGLALVRRIIYKHGGRIWAEAEENKGATFFFTVPDGPKAALEHRADSEYQ
jgi:PAS domain S-box-containing protein